MAERVRLAIVGCGGMGRRHLAGLAELARTDHNNVELVAVCDLNERNAEALADEARALLGSRPRVFRDMATMAREAEGLEAADCTTDTGSHHAVAAALLDLGLHTLCEKPLALTIRGCDRVIAAAARAGKLLSVAENYRRDPINRLARALLDAGAIGQRQFIMETGVGGRDNLFITPWRHQKLSGALTLDAGVHNADILQYYFGDAASVYGQVRLYEPVRVKRDTAGPGGFYQQWADLLPDMVTATGEDAMFGTIAFANGALGQWVGHYAGHGQPFHHRMVFGTRGSLAAPGDRNGRPIRLTLDDGTDIVDGRILDYVPDYRLDPAAAALFGGERVWTYEFDFPTTDRKIIALEYHELAACVRTGAAPEVDGAVAKRDVALVYALFESDRAGRPVTIAEVESGAVDAYQREIDEHLGLV
ncbi:MAG TPA: Gfo/Idh/MocA family oxidoreductase [Thermomicrobiales bacterium]|nr:Gfo/Idh/MocA family oxidoreductase [Thermomicrobiales bacterium]